MPPKKRGTKPSAGAPLLTAARERRRRQLVEEFGQHAVAPESDIAFLSCDVCGRMPISAWQFKPVKDTEKDCCYPCARSGRAKAAVGPVKLVGWAPRIPVDMVASPELAETSSDEEQGVANRRSALLGNDLVGGTSTARSAKGKPAPKGSKRGQQQRNVATKKVQPPSSSSSSSSSDEAASSSSSGSEADDESEETGTEGTTTASSSTDRGQRTSPRRAAAKRATPLPRAATVSRKPPSKQTANKTTTTATKATKAADAAVGKAKATRPAKTNQKTTEQPPAPTTSGNRTERSSESAEQQDELPKPQPPKANPKASKRIREEQAPDPGRSLGVSDPLETKAATPPQPQAEGSSTPSDRRSLSPKAVPPRPPTAAGEGLRTGQKREPVGPVQETEVVRYLRALPCVATPDASPLQMDDCAPHVYIDEHKIPAGDSVTLALEPDEANKTNHRQSCHIAVSYGTIVSVRVVPTRSDEVWVSVLVRGEATAHLGLWKSLPGSPPMIQSFVTLGKQSALCDRAAFEWVPAPHNDHTRLGFGSLLRGNTVVSAAIPFPGTASSAQGEGSLAGTSPYVKNRICGILQLQHDLKASAIRWATNGTDVSRTYLTAAFQCSTVITYFLEHTQQTENLVLAPAHRFPPSRLSLPRLLPTPIVVGLRDKLGATYVAVAHGTVLMIIEDGERLNSVTQLTAPIATLAAAQKGVYCGTDGGATTYVKLSGRNHVVDALLLQVTPSGILPREHDIVLCGANGVVGRWLPPAPLDSLLQVHCTRAGAVQITGWPDLSAPLPPSDIPVTAVFPAATTFGPAVDHFVVAVISESAFAVVDVPSATASSSV